MAVLVLSGESMKKTRSTGMTSAKITTTLSGLILSLLIATLAGCETTKVPEPEILPINNPAPAGKTFLLEGFEEGNFWEAVSDSWDKWGNHNYSLKTALTKEWASEGKSSAAWDFDAMMTIIPENEKKKKRPPKKSGSAPKQDYQATFVCNALLKNNWTPYESLAVDFNNLTGKPLRVNVAVQDGTEWKWTETEIFTLGPGENKNVIFSLTERLKSDGQETSALVNGDNIYCAAIQVLGENEGGKLLVDNIRLVKKQ